MTLNWWARRRANQVRAQLLGWDTDKIIRYEDLGGGCGRTYYANGNVWYEEYVPGSRVHTSDTYGHWEVKKTTSIGHHLWYIFAP